MKLTLIFLILFLSPFSFVGCDLESEQGIVDYESCIKKYGYEATESELVCKSKDGRVFTQAKVIPEMPVTQEVVTTTTETPVEENTIEQSEDAQEEVVIQEEPIEEPVVEEPANEETSSEEQEVPVTVPDSSEPTIPDDSTQLASEPPPPALQIPLGSVLTPYVNEADVSSVNEAYTMVAENAPWGFYHPGVDFMITKESIPVQAAYSGKISQLDTTLSSGIMGWHTGFCIEYGENGVCYNLETFSADPAIGERQRAGMLIQNGQMVTAGQSIGSLIYGGSGAHIDFGITSPGTRVCPEPYFTEAARASVIRLIHKSQPTWQMCY